jgi:hypothetical protein
MTSPLRHCTSLPIRPFYNKEMDSVDLDQLFEEYVETDLLQHYSDPITDGSSSEDLAQLFDLPSSNESALFSSSPLPNQDADMAWHKAVQRTEQNPALTMSTDSSSFYVDAKGKGSLSDSELLNIEDLLELERNQLRSYSQPSTPRPYHTTKAVKKAVSFQQDRTIPRGIHKLSRKSSTPAFTKMMQPSFYRSPIPDVWTRKMEPTADSYSLRVSSNGITSPPPSSKLVQNENSSGFFGQHHQHQPYSDDQSPLASPNPGMSFTNYQITPQASPAIGISNNNTNNDPFNDNMGLTYSNSVSSAALSALQTPPSSLRMPMTAWGPTDTSSPNLDFSFSASPDFSGTKTAGWWDGAAAPTYRESAQRTTSQTPFGSVSGMNGRGMDGRSMDGLGISGADTASFGDYGLANDTASFDMGHAHNSHTHYTTAPAMYPVQPHQPQPQQQQQHIVSIGQPRLSRTPSPNLQPHFHRRRQSTHAAHQRQQPAARRKSSTTALRQPSVSAGNVGFVNFTPHDSRKILTGVAPSGSSKTKARREKEAAEKRRKLSQAAMKAVMEAGGDVDSLRRLEREGLLMLES